MKHTCMHTQIFVETLSTDHSVLAKEYPASNDPLLVSVLLQRLCLAVATTLCVTKVGVQFL